MAEEEMEPQQHHRRRTSRVSCMALGDAIRFHSLARSPTFPARCYILLTPDVTISLTWEGLVTYPSGYVEHDPEEPEYNVEWESNHRNPGALARIARRRVARHQGESHVTERRAVTVYSSPT